MSDTIIDQRVTNAVQDVATKVEKFKDRDIGEQNTKASLIEPILDALGWDIRDPDEVHREYKPTPRDCPVDYALKLLRKPRLFLEAKGLGEDLSDRKWVTQVLGYAVVAGVEWCILTDGDCYRFYNAAATVDAEEKLFCTFQLSRAGAAEAVRTLNLISRRNLEDNLLDVLWGAHFVDRRVKTAVQSMFTSVDRALVRLIRRKTVKLTPKQIADSLRRLDVRIDLAMIAPSPPASRVMQPRQQELQQAERKRADASSRRAQKPKVSYGVTLSDIIEAGLLTPPLPLFRRYKGRRMEAILHEDGTVEFGGKIYRTCSTAAESARASVTGRPMNTNGWSFWQYQDGNGRPKELFAARTEYLATHPQQRPRLSI